MTAIYGRGVRVRRVDRAVELEQQGDRPADSRRRRRDATDAHAFVGADIAPEAPGAFAVGPPEGGGDHAAVQWFSEGRDDVHVGGEVGAGLDRRWQPVGNDDHELARGSERVVPELV